MDITRDDGRIQIEVNDGSAVLVTIGHNKHHGFSGNVLTIGVEKPMEIVSFHGDGKNGVIVHGPVPFKGPGHDPESNGGNHG